MKQNSQPTKFERRPSGLLAPAEHHSVSDWDKSPNAFYNLDPTIYYSPPKSLNLGGTGATEYINLFLSRIPETLNLPQGRIVTQFRTTTLYIEANIAFRNQKALGGADLEDGYYVQIAKDGWLLNKVINGTVTWEGWGETSLTAYEWMKFRATWWNGVTPDSLPALTFSLEKFDGAEWIQQGDYAYDTNNQWANSNINRCGITNNAGPEGQVWFDDTEIWGPE